jgi:hypothetical protein
MTYPPVCHAEVLDRLARIETKLDDMIGARTDHESRIRILETRWHWASGAAAIVGAIAGLVTSHLPRL